MADASAFILSVENPQHNVDVCNNSALAKTIEEIDTIRYSAECISFCGWQHLPLGGYDQP